MHVASARDLVETVGGTTKLSPEARANVLAWLQDPSLDEFVPELRALIDEENWTELEDSFFKHINIGTGGLRGQIGPGPNRINSRTIGEAAQALCYFIDARGDEAKAGGIVVGYEARRNSRAFATMCADVFAANGIPSYLFDDVRATPEISFAVRHMNATAGVQITASHNPKTDNGFKFYWSYGGYDSKHPGRRYGGQVVPPMDAEFMQLVRGVKEISPPPPPEVRAKFVRPVPREVDTAYWESVGGLSLVSNRSARVVFGAIHGAGKMNVLPVLQNAGFEVFAMQEQIEPNENFPQAAGKLINPEFREVVKPALEYARAVEADIAVCSDPDADRAGILARTELQRADSLELLRGDDVGAALTHFVLDQRRALGKTGPDDLVLETLVTTSLIGDIARSYGVQCIDDLLVGFKWVAQVLQQREDAGRVGFFFAAEESIGYLAGNFVRDKDASIAALLVSELASWLKDRNQTIWDLLDELYVRHGFYKNLQYLIELPGKAGMEVMQEVMLGLRALAGANKISKIAERDVAGWSDLLAPESTRRGAYALGKADDILTFWLSPDKKSRVTLRPSGTEPKLKYYVQLYEPAVDDLARVKARYEAEARAVALDLVEWSARSIGEGLDPARREILREQWGRGEPRFV